MARRAAWTTCGARAVTTVEIIHPT